MNSLHIVCPLCQTVNRILASRLSQEPRCGKCKNALFIGQPIELSASNFQQHITRNEIPVVVDFWAPWCGPCKMMAPAYAKAAQKLEPHVRLAKLNTDQEQAISSQFNIRSIPTLIIFKNGQELARKAGAMSEIDIIRLVNSSIQS